MTDLAFINEYKGTDNLDDFSNKVIEVANNLGIQPDWLMGVMDFESSLNPQSQNRIGATGLVQFMPDTAIGLGTTTDALKHMNGVQQLDYVQKYFQNVIRQYGSLGSYTDTYLAVFFPAAIPLSSDSIIQTSNLSADTIARENPVFDIGNKGYILKSDVESVITSRVPSGFEDVFSGAVRFVKNNLTGVYIALAGLVVLTVGFIFYEINKK